MPKQALLTLCTTTLENMKAKDIVTLNIGEKSSIADYFIIATGTSSRHVKAIGEELIKEIKKKHYQALGILGLEQGDWVLVDLGDIVVHIMQAETRDYYNLEALWANKCTSI